MERYRELFAEGQLERSLPKGALLPASEGGGDPVRDLRGGEATGRVRHLDGVALRDEAARGCAFLHQQLAVRSSRGEYGHLRRYDVERGERGHAGLLPGS